MDLPFGLDRQRNLEREDHSAWLRRVALLVVLALVILGVLNVFGQRAAVSTISANGVSLTVDSPTALRGGLIYTTQIRVATQAPIQDMHLVLSEDWLRGMTLNGIAPQASSDNASDAGLDLDYQNMDAGQSFVMWISWQVNPTNIGSRDQVVTIKDGPKPLVTMQRSVFIFP